MKKIFAILFSVSALLSAQNYQLTVKVFSSNLKESDTLFIAGNNSQFGNWSPNKIPLTKINDSLWSKTFSFPDNEILEFKFTKGSWDKEALTDVKTVPQNYVLKILNDTLFETRINYWRGETSVEGGFEGQVTGTVQRLGKFSYEGILPRDVAVWLPPDYEAFPEKRFPVLYMHDGQNLFDPKTSFTGIDWQIDETADSLIRKGKMNSVIIVGINNTADRSVEYAPAKKGKAYMDFIVNKLKPFIDSTFRTKPEREFTATGGSSMGGLISFMLAWTRDDVFSKAICMSPAFVYDGVDFVDYVKSYRGEKKDIQIYIDNGGVGLEEKLQPGITKMLAALDEQGFRSGLDLFYLKDSTAQHNEAAWAKRIKTPLLLFYGEKNSSDCELTKKKYDDDVMYLRHRIMLGILTLNDDRYSASGGMISYNYKASFIFDLPDKNIGFGVFVQPALRMYFTDGFPFVFEGLFGPEMRIEKSFYLDLYFSATNPFLFDFNKSFEFGCGGTAGFIFNVSESSNVEFLFGLREFRNYLYCNFEMGISFN